MLIKRLRGRDNLLARKVLIVSFVAMVGSAQADEKKPQQISGTDILRIAAEQLESDSVPSKPPTLKYAAEGRALIYYPGEAAVLPTTDDTALRYLANTALQAALLKETVFTKEKDRKLVDSYYAKLVANIESQLAIMQAKETNDSAKLAALKAKSEEATEILDDAVFEWAKSRKGVDIFAKKSLYAADIFTVEIEAPTASDIGFVPEFFSLIAEIEGREPRWIDCNHGDVLNLNGVYVFRATISDEDKRFRKRVTKSGKLAIP